MPAFIPKPHFFLPHDGHDILEQKWRALTPSLPQLHESLTATSFDPAALRERLVSPQKSTARNVLVALHALHDPRRNLREIEPREATLLLLLATDLRFASPQHDWSACFDELLARSHSTLTPEEARIRLGELFEAYVNHSPYHTPTPDMLGVVVRPLLTLFGAEEALRLILATVHQRAMGPALDALRLYASPEALKAFAARADTLLARWEQHRPKDETLLMDTRLAMISLAPTRDRISRTLAACDPTNRLFSRNTIEAIFARIHDPETFEHFLYEAPRHKLLPTLSPVLLVCHMHTLGMRRLEEFYTQAMSRVGAWDMLQWGILFKIHSSRHAPERRETRAPCAPSPTLFALTLIAFKGQNRHFQPEALRWINQEGANAIIDCLDVVAREHEFAPEASTVLKTYVKRGHSELIATCGALILEALPEAERHLAPRYEALLEELMAQRMETVAEAPPFPEALLPRWLDRWQGRGITRHDLSPHDLAHMPRVTLRDHPEVTLDQRTLTGVLRLLQANARHLRPEAYALRRWLSTEGKQRLITHLELLYKINGSHRSQRWMFFVRAVLAEEDEILNYCKHFTAKPTHEMFENLGVELLQQTQHPHALRKLTTYIVTQILASPKPHPLPQHSLLRNLATTRQMNEVAFLEHYAPKLGHAHQGKLYFRAVERQLSLHYDDAMEPVVAMVGERTEQDEELGFDLVIFLDHVKKMIVAPETETLVTLFTRVLSWAMQQGLRWDYASWRSAMEHPLVRQFHRAILWEVGLKEPGGRRTLRARLLEDLQLYDMHDEPLPSARLDQAKLRIANLEQLTPHEAQRWGELLGDDEIHLVIQNL